MAQFDNQQFTEKVLKLYAESLRQRLPRVKFMLDDDSGTVRDAISQKVYRLVREYTKSEVPFCLDDHLRGDGSVDEEMALGDKDRKRLARLNIRLWLKPVSTFRLVVTPATTPLSFSGLVSPAPCALPLPGRWRTSALYVLLRRGGEILQEFYGVLQGALAG